MRSNVRNCLNLSNSNTALHIIASAGCSVRSGGSNPVVGASRPLCLRLEHVGLKRLLLATPQMILTPIDFDALPGLLAAFGAALEPHVLARRVFSRIVASAPISRDLELSTDASHHADAAELCKSFGFGIVDADPHDYFTWDGSAVALRMEPSLLLHEIGHYQSAAPARRNLADFGLGGGPETGRKSEADKIRRVTDLEADIEEALASLLGILWEAELGQPAVAAFLEQNWLEGGATPRNLDHFCKIVTVLATHGLIDHRGQPTRVLREQADEPFFVAWSSFPESPVPPGSAPGAASHRAG